MKKIFTLILLSLFTFSFSQNVSPEYVDGQIFLKFRTGTIKNISKDDPNNIPLNKIAILQELIGKYGITKAYKPFYQADDDIRLTHILQLEFTNAAKINDLIADLSSNRIVEYAEKVMLLKTHVTPNDPTVGAHLTQIGAQNAWGVWNSTSNGNSNITVAIVDNAIDRSHPDLVANIYTNAGEIPANNIDDDQNGYVDDVNGYDVADVDNNTIPTNNAMDHGTHTSGIAGGRTDNSVGIASIGWNIKVIPVKCAKDADPTTSVNYGYQGIIYAAKAKARIISCSWGGTGAPSSAAQSIIDYAWNKGCVIFCSAGNNGNNTICYPAGYNNVCSVASLASNSVKSSFSCYGTWVDISAPGENILSTTPANTYQSFSGTSMACPLVAGTAGLMLSKYPYMTQANVLNCLYTTASNIYTIAANSAYSPNQLGVGMVNAYQAMLCAASYTGTPPIANFYTLTRNTCPGTPISFIDSSGYNPTSWSWSFPGAIPATSTSSNPSITYASPGIYNVTMTVSNTNGGNTKVRNSYITIAGPIALPLVEGFQTANFLPTNWTSMNIGNDSVYWELKQGVGGFTVAASAQCAMFDDYDEDATGDRDEMRTPRYNFSNVANAKLRFDVAYKQYDNTANITPQNAFSDTLEVRLSTNCGVSSTQIYNKGGQTLSTSPGTLQANIFVPLATEWRTDSININAQAAFQPNVMAHFINRGHYGQAMYVDNINIFLPAPTMAVAGPSLGCTNTAYTFTNTTTGAAGYTWTSNPPSSISAPNGTNTNITFTSPGAYSITCTANNGTVTNLVVKTITVSTQPTVAIANSTNNVCSGTNVTLTASGASTYSWSTSQTTSVIVVTPSANTTYTVQGNNNNCFMVQSIALNATVTPTVTASNQTICASGTATIIAAGAATYSWSTGFVGNPLIISPSANTVVTVFGNNGVCANSKTVGITIGSSITIIPSATTPTICAGGTVGLSATGATTYTWNPGNLNGANQTVTPASSTTYTVAGTNAGCNGNATIAISIIAPPALVLTPNSSSICAGGSSTVNATGYTTYTWNPGNLSGSSQILSPAATQIYTVQGKIGNCNGTSTAVVSVVNLPTVTISGSTFMCVGNSVVLTANGAGTYTWTAGPMTNTNSVSPASNATFIVTGANSNCTSTAAISVSVNPNPTVAVASSSNPICIGDAVNLTASGANTYTWNGGSQFNPIFVSPTVTTQYTVTGTANGCTSTAVFEMTVNSCGGVGLKTQSNAGNALLIFPNPSTDVINITYVGKKFDYVMYDNIGRLICSEKNIENAVKIKTGDYAKGVYYIEVVSDGEKIRRKLIKD
jgi:subtilisin family serine protease